MSDQFPDSTRRSLLRFAGGASLVFLVTPIARAALSPNVVSVRVWPATDYTRVTLETDAVVKFSQFTVKGPERLVVDLEGVEFNGVLEGLAGKISATDPYIKLLRAGRFKPGVVRLVMELKTEVVPQVFVLKPVGEYGHRLVLDVYPAEPPDPLLSLLDKKEQKVALLPQTSSVESNTELTLDKQISTEQAERRQLAQATKPSQPAPQPTPPLQVQQPMPATPPSKAEVKPEPKPELKPEQRPEPKAEPKPEPKAELKPEPKLKAEPKLEPAQQAQPVQYSEQSDLAQQFEPTLRFQPTTQMAQQQPVRVKGQTGSNSRYTQSQQPQQLAKVPVESRRSTRPVVDRLVTITLDPGHGGEDPGAVGRRGTYEKHVTLSVARRLKAKIDAEPNMRAVLTRDSDFFVPLHMRVIKARRVQSDLFVSIHADAFVNPTARGASVFVLSENGASSSTARWLANKENGSDLIGGVNFNTKDPVLARTLLDLSHTATISDSLKLGKAVLDELDRVGNLHNGSVEKAGFAVLKAPDIPSILVETAFISNPEEERRLNEDSYQDKLADAVMSGIRKYFSMNPPLAKSKIAQLD